ncbi:hypothetical protein D1B31_08140 [Neobacillus notoginsengisoli]|uniref:Uncharacterized protein n=1 Tax=Neobacillus notoginsengisoli TaxID=1578198 RepID=A0A417YW76_9BACI|nr:hypothetical protein [Neobacillus notoginsengisoli]RHW41673.1 hypothetical protein D1B31_08140 [Neobacillus notoginsengisoli]
MDENKVLNFAVEMDLIEKFNMALKLNNEESKVVFTRLMNEYIAEAFSKAAGIVPNRIRKTKQVKITEEMTHVAYTYAKKVYRGELSRTEGKLEVERISGMKAGSAQDYITDFLAMMEGKEYQRVMSNYGTQYFLENIRKDFGEQAFLNAIEATEKHIKYYNSLGYGRLKAKEELVNKLRETVNV